MTQILEPGILGPMLGQSGIGGSGAEQTYIEKVLALSPIAYWPLNETSGTSADNAEGTAARDGTYVNTPTLNQTGIGDGNGAPLFTAASSERVNIFSDSLETAANMAEGTLIVWGRVRVVGVWTDGVFRCIFTIRADADNLIQLQKASGNNLLAFVYSAGGTAEQRDKSSVSTTDWFHMALTWSVLADEVIAYYDGIQEGAIMTGLGTWAGAFDSGRVVIADRGAGFSPHDGYCAHVALWDTPLSAADILSLATV